MTALFLLWLAASPLATQSTSPLALDIRVFRGASEVTQATQVTVYPTGNRANGRPAPQVGSGERQLYLSPGRYDLQLVQHDEGKVVGLAWTTLRLLVDYPGEHQRHLEVINFDKNWGALQIRPAGPLTTGPLTWSARLVRPDGSEASRGVEGDGYQVLVAPAGTYTVEITRSDGSRTRLANTTVDANLTYVRTF